MSQPGGAPQAASAYPPDMIRPEKIANIPMLSAEKKVTYTEGLTKLWTALEANPRGSETHNKATAKIKEVSREIMRHITQWKANSQNQQQRPQQSQAQAPQPQQNQQQPQQPQQQQAQPTTQQQQPQQQNPQSQIPNPQPQQQPQQQQQQQHHPQQAQQQIPQQQQQQQQIPRVPGNINNFPLGPQAKAFLNGFKVFPPTNIIPNTPEYENYKRSIMSTLTRLVTMQESSVGRFQQTHEKITQMENTGQTATPDLVSARDAARMGVQDAKSKIDTVRNENEKNRLAWADKSKPPQQNNSQTPMPQQQQVASPYNQSAQANNPASAMSPAVPYQQQSNVPMHAQQQQQPQQPIARPPNQQQPYQSPAPSGQPQALSHADAINQAQRTYSAQQVQGGGGTPTSQPGGQAFNHTQQTALNVGNPKFPIPKNLPTTGTHNPVPLGPARPTFGGPSNGAPGMMGQPAVQKTPHFILEGEGDRVLSKKKLDELVRQVTGGGEGDGLTPDVEESVLTLADDFVDSVITAACRLAKIRPNTTLDIRDIQIILERNYNIRVPGYSLDEVRTVRKFQPAPGWTQKMNAVQAAKVMGKNDA
ncbi:hypothetical protein KCU77_g11360, partial [Aureobasidium melanogenum]